LVLALAGCDDDEPAPRAEICPPLVAPNLDDLTCDSLVCSEGSCPDGALWGYADLHTHPASHFAMGADTSGTNGPFYGDPDGLVAPDGTPLPAAIPACDGNKHYNPPDAPLDTLITNTYNALESTGGANHLPSGSANGYESWPSARSPTHQQMHVEWLHRAYQGGLRLIVASVTDNQVFETLWTRQLAISWASDLDPKGSHGRDLASAERQLDYIDRLVANHDWMEIVRSPEEAECAIRSGRLAVVLALEMDSLTSTEMLKLAAEKDVRLVTPIHLRDHPEFGGMAVYRDLFNTASRALNTDEEHVSVVEDSSVTFRYGAPHFMGDFPWLGLSLFANQISIADPPNSACNIGYQTCAWDALPPVDGHVNALGLRAEGESGIRSLMECGLIVDVAHMSDKAVDDTVDLASAYEIPVVVSHANLRDYIGEGEGSGDPQNVTERSVRRDLVERIGSMGGMFGLGTSGDMGLQPIGRDDGDALLVFDPDTSGSQRWIPDQPFLRVLLRSGADGLRDGASVDWSVEGTVDASGVLEEYRDHRLREVGTFEDHGIDWVDLRLPPGTTTSDLSSLRLVLQQEDCAACTSENWDLEGIEVFLYEPNAITLLAQSHGAAHRFTESDDTLAISLAPDPRDVLDVQLWTGGDDLRCGSWVDMRLELFNGTSVLWSDATGQRLTPHDGMPDNTFHRRPVILPTGYDRDSVRSIGLALEAKEDCGVAYTSDNWNLEAIRIEARAADRREVVVDRHGWTLHRFSETDSELALPVVPWHEYRPLWGRFLWLTVETGTDDLRAGNTAEATVRVGGVNTIVALNQGTLWRDRSVHRVLVDLGSEVDLTRVEHVDIAVNEAFDETWRINRLALDAVGTPIADWWAEYQEIQHLLRGRGVAFGSDLNGFEVQLSVAEVGPTYPLRPLDHPAGGSLSRQELGTRLTDFQREGLSNIGQLPDWVGAVEAVDPVTPDDTRPLYSSAKDFVELWYRVRDNASSIP